LTSGAGRLFDAVSALTGLCTKASFDSEAPMRLESAINCRTDLYYPFNSGETIAFYDTFLAILDDLNHPDVSLMSAKFHNTIARIILNVSEKIRKDYSLDNVVLSGGVFQNKYLLEKSIQLLTKKDFKVFTNHQVPSNDGGISLGQTVIASKFYGLCV
jgi:hydrogenase maturation protein HypF